MWWSSAISLQAFQSMVCLLYDSSVHKCVFVSHKYGHENIGQYWYSDKAEWSYWKNVRFYIFTSTQSSHLTFSVKIFFFPPFDHLLRRYGDYKLKRESHQISIVNVDYTCFAFFFSLENIFSHLSKKFPKPSDQLKAIRYC
jgi:hypothetical protein